jgi:hypothetical protein
MSGLALVFSPKHAVTTDFGIVVPAFFFVSQNLLITSQGSVFPVLKKIESFAILLHIAAGGGASRSRESASVTRFAPTLNRSTLKSDSFSKKRYVSASLLHIVTRGTPCQISSSSHKFHEPSAHCLVRGPPSQL